MAKPEKQSWEIISSTPFQSARGFRRLRIFTEKNLDVEAACVCLDVQPKFSFLQYPV